MTISRRVLPQFLRALAHVDAPVTMVVDDVHDMAGVQAAVVLTALPDALLAGSQLALVGRLRLDLPVALWRRQGRVREVGASDLAFDQDETSRLIARLDLPARLSERTVAEIAAARMGGPLPCTCSRWLRRT